MIERLQALPWHKRLAYCLAAIERMMPWMSEWYERESRVVPRLYSEVVRKMWDALIDGPESVHDVEELCDECEALIPQSEVEDPDNPFGRCQDTALSIVNTLTMFEPRDNLRTITVVTHYARDVARSLAYDRSGLDPSVEDIWEKVKEIEPLRTELATQQAVCEFLESYELSTQRDVVEFIGKFGKPVK